MAGRALFTRLTLRWWTYDHHKSVNFSEPEPDVVVVAGKKDSYIPEYREPSSGYNSGKISGPKALTVLATASIM